MGLQVAGWLPPRKPDKPSCTLDFTFSGPRISEDQDAAISNITIIRATDDTGINLLWTNPSNVEIDPSAGGFYRAGIFERELRAHVVLKSPSAEAKSLQLEGNADLLTPTIPRVVFPNIIAQSGAILKDPLFDKYGVYIKVLDRLNDQPQTIAFEYKDLNHKLRQISFRHGDGTPVYEKSSSEMQIGTNKIVSYTFDLKSLQDVDLAVQLDVPQRQEPTHFRISSLALPWIQPTNFEVIQTLVLPLDASTNQRGCLLLAAFKGGLLTNAAAIRRVSITKIVSDPPEEVDATLNDLAPYSPTSRSELKDGGAVIKPIGIYIHTPGAVRIKLLEGDAELVYSAGAIGPTAELNSDLEPGEVITNVKLKEQGVIFTFIGTRNYRTMAQKLIKSDRIAFGSRGKETSDDVNDALLFSYEDPQRARPSHVVVPMGFFDEKQKPVPYTDFLFTPKSYLIRFDKLPKRTRIKMNLLNRSAIHHVHFKLENILVPAITKHYLESIEAFELQWEDAFWWGYFDSTREK